MTDTVQVPREHQLKTVQPYFDAVMCGQKTFEIRLNDRGFAVGDTLILREWTGAGYTGLELRRAISYMTDFAQQEGYVVLGLAAAPQVAAEPVAWRYQVKPGVYEFSRKRFDYYYLDAAGEWIKGEPLYTHAEPVAEAQPAEPINQQLLQALRQVAQAHAWLAFGECRSFGADVPLLTPSDADALARAAIAAAEAQPSTSCAGCPWPKGCETHGSCREAQPALPTQEQIMRLANELESCAMTLCLCKLEDKETYRADLDEARAALQAALSALPKEQP